MLHSAMSRLRDLMHWESIPKIGGVITRIGCRGRSHTVREDDQLQTNLGT